MQSLLAALITGLLIGSLTTRIEHNSLFGSPDDSGLVGGEGANSRVL